MEVYNIMKCFQKVVVLRREYNIKLYILKEKYKDVDVIYTKECVEDIKNNKRVIGRKDHDKRNTRFSIILSS